MPNKEWILVYFWRLATPARCTTGGLKKAARSALNPEKQLLESGAVVEE